MAYRAMMKATISTHNGSSAHRDHNIRNPKVVSKEDHIDPNGQYEIWHDEKPREAYKRIFGASLAKYNARVRADRQIKDYFSHIEKDSKKHPVYEMIIGVYRANIPDEEKKAILREFVDDWKNRNPNLEMIGAYWHNDEEGEMHVHIDYVPVAHGFQKGMETQSGLVRALGEMGFRTLSKHMTAQISWEQRENAYLEFLCLQRGIEIDHPSEEGQKHLHTSTYKAQKDLERAIDNYNDLEDIMAHERADFDAEMTLKQELCDRTVEKAVKADEAVVRAREELEWLNGQIAMKKTELKEVQKRYKGESMTEREVYAKLMGKTASGKPKRAKKIDGETLVAVNKFLAERKTIEALRESVERKQRALDEREAEIRKLEFDIRTNKTLAQENARQTEELLKQTKADITDFASKEYKKFREFCSDLTITGADGKKMSVTEAFDKTQAPSRSTWLHR